MPDIALPGCRPEPLAAYLKGLGLFRLVAEQIDAQACVRWHADELHLSSPLDLGGLVEFLVDRYRPTPLVAPWNKGSGFGADDARTSPKATATVGAVRDSDDPRLASYRRTIAVVDALRRRVDWYALSKEDQVALCRSALPDDAVGWLDASVVLSAESRAFPPLLGTGGNDGRFDFASNFMDRLLQMLGQRTRARGAAAPAVLARSALTGEVAVLDRAAIGQFDPAGAGGPGSFALGPAEAIANPWDFILLLEGAVLFASGAARRMSGQPATAMPFMVRSSAAGHPTAAADEVSRGELWAPLWSAPAKLSELSRLIGEGRAEFSGRQAVTGLDVARALSTLGVDRGLSGFVRHSFLERNGLSTFAVPVGRVAARATAGSGLTAQLDGWAQAMRRVSNPPGSLQSLLRRLDDSLFALAASGGATVLQRVLVTVAEIDRLGAGSTSVRRAVSPLATRLPARDWLPALDDGTPEHELAAALASLRVDRRSLLRPTLTDASWSGRPAPVDGFGQRPLVPVLADALVRIEIDHGRAADEHGRLVWLPGARWSAAPLTAVELLADGAIDDTRFGDLLGAYLLLDWEERPAVAERPRRARERPSNPAFAVVRPFFHPGWHDRSQHLGPLVAEPGWARQLVAGQVERVVGDAVRRLRIAGYEPLVRAHSSGALDVDGERLAAACLIPLSDRDVASLLHRVVAPPDVEKPPSSPTEEPA